MCLNSDTHSFEISTSTRVIVHNLTMYQTELFFKKNIFLANFDAEVIFFDEVFLFVFLPESFKIFPFVKNGIPYDA